MRTSASALQLTRQFFDVRRGKFFPLVVLASFLSSLLPRVAFADPAPAPSPGGAPGMYDAALGVPETGAAVSNHGGPVSVDAATGIANVSYPFVLPPARGHAQPQLGLQYSSAAGKGIGGYGWSLDLPYIERAPLSGPPSYDDSWTVPVNGVYGQGNLPNGNGQARFIFQGQALVPICTIPDNVNCFPGEKGYLKGNYHERFPGFTSSGSWTYFRLETGGADTRFFWSGDHQTWIVQYKSGEMLELGHPLVPESWFGDAVDRDNDNPSNIFRWNIVRQYDSERQNGVPVNRINYFWTKIAGDARMYLSDIYYTILGSAAGTYPADLGMFADHVHLVYDTSYAKPAIPSFVPSIWRSPPNFVLSHVDVTAASFSASTSGGGAVAPPVPRRLVRRYWLKHNPDTDAAASNRVLLSTIQLEGRCAVAGADMEITGGDATIQYTVSASSGCPRMQPTTYTYEDVPLTYQETSLVPVSAPSKLSAPGTFLYDINSDGIPDAVVPNTPAGSTFPTSLTTYLTSSATTSAGTATTLAGPSTVAITYPSDFSLTTPSYSPYTFFSNGNSPTPGQTFPGNYFGDGRLNLLIAGTASSGIDQLQFAALTPGQNLSLKGSTQNMYLHAEGNSSGGDASYAESVIAVTDVDGDGYPDAITDSPMYVSTPGSPPPPQNPMPGEHALTLRTTYAQLNGTINPFFALKSPTVVTGAGAPLPLGLLPISRYYADIPLLSPVDLTLLPSESRLFGQAYSGSNPYPNLVFYADMNGDGLVDWVTLDNAGSHLSYWVGHGDGTFGSCASGLNDCAGDARFKGVNASTPFGGVPSIASGSDVLFHDVTGDGYADLVVVWNVLCGESCDKFSEITIYVNQGGTSFDSGTAIEGTLSFGGNSGINHVWSLKPQIFFADMNGSGVDDVVILSAGGDLFYADIKGGHRPGLLKTIQNGYGATTTIKYATTTDLAQQAVAAGTPWATSSPQVLHHVVDVSSTNGMPGPYAETRDVSYQYANPVYDGRDRSFVGFQTVTVQTAGDATEPTVATTTRYLTGVCSADGAGLNCATAGVDRPFLPLRGLPVSVDTYDGAGHSLASKHIRYDVRRPFAGIDGRGVRFAYPSVEDTYHYDSSASHDSSSTTTLSASDAIWDDEPGTVAIAPRNIPLAFPLPNIVQTQTSAVRDLYGNATSVSDNGVVSTAGGGTPRGDGIYDAPLTTTYLWLETGADGFGWRPWQVTRAAFPTAAGAPAADLPLVVQLTYAPDSQVSNETVTVSGVLPLERASYGLAYPAAAVTNGQAIVNSYLYDAYGNPTFVIRPGTCSETEYDGTFAQFPTSVLRYRDGCTAAGIPLSNIAIATSQSVDYGFARPTMSVSNTGATTTYTYDGFGRRLTTSLPDPVSGATQGTATISATYYDNTATLPLDTSFPVTQTSVSVTDGSQIRTTWSYADAWGQPLVTLSPGDTSQGDASSWIARGQVQRSARGDVVRSFAPYFFTQGNDPTAFSFAALPSAPSTSARYDAFGRVLTTVGLDNATVTSRSEYHPLAVNLWDADQVAGLHQGYSYSVLDGHGRTVRQGQQVRPTNASTVLDERVITTAYTAGGKPWVVTQSHLADSYQTKVQRTFQYDSLGHMVSNVEPNTSTTGIGWRYVYDANGLLVATSDDNGCGENLAYDGLGRLVWEDYSACTAAQVAGIGTSTTGPSGWSSSQTPLNTAGVETFFVYDPVTGGLQTSYDRGAQTSYAYDARQRVIEVTRSLAAPTGLSPIRPIGTASNYASDGFTRSFLYDNLNRPTGATTGADVPAVLGTPISSGTITSASLVTGTYSARGTLASVQGSYGTLLASNVADADGAPLTQVFGDAAATTAFRCYDANRNLSELGLYRGTALPACAHAPVGGGGAAPANHLKVLDERFTRDNAGNPTAIADGRDPFEWAPGALPVSRSLTYDDSNRLVQAQYSYKAAIGSGTTDTTAYAPTPQATPYQSPLLPIAVAPTRVQQQTFAYDWLGNTTNTTDDKSLYFERSLPTITNGTAAAGPNRMTAARYGTPSFFGGKRYATETNVTYDNAGNVTSLSAIVNSGSCANAPHCAVYFTFQWDELGRLAGAERTDDQNVSPSAYVNYTYDAGGKRVLRESSPTFAGNEGTTFDAEVFPSLRLNNATWQQNTSTYQRDATTETAYLDFGGASFGRVVPNTNVHALPHVLLTLSDAQGSTAAVIDQASGELVERLTYTAYGMVESDYRPADWANFSEQYKYTGKEPDAEVGLVYFGARYYSPYLGRWLSPDPLTIHGLASDPNPYAFAQGSPVRYVDPNGLCVTENGGECNAGPSLDPTGGSGGGISINFGQAGQWLGNAANWVGKSVGSWFSKSPPPPPPPPPATGVPSFSYSNTDPMGAPTDPGGLERFGTFSGNTGATLTNAGVDFLKMTMVLFNGAPLSAVGMIPHIQGPQEGTPEAGAGAIMGTGMAIVGPGLLSAPAATAEIGTGRAYSVLFETRLQMPNAIGDGSRGFHNMLANQALADAMEADEGFAAIVRKFIPDLGATGDSSRAPGAAWTWHHAQETGVMQLVPRAQHTAPGFIQSLLHPGGSGGFDLWGHLF